MATRLLSPRARLRVALAAMALLAFLAPCSLHAGDPPPAITGGGTLADRLARDGGAATAATSAAPAIEPTKRPLLWRVEGGAATKPTYLFGTVHIPDPRVTALHQVVTDAIAATDGLFTEIELDMGAQATLAGKMMLEEGKGLSEVLEPELYGRLRRYMREKGRGMRRMERMKPWAVAMQIVTIEFVRPSGTGEVLDLTLKSKAGALGKQLGGVETLDEHLHAFESLSYEEQGMLLESALDSIVEAEKFEELVAAYLAGDEETIGSMMRDLMFEDGEPLSAKLYKTLLVDRNGLMAMRIDERIRADASKGWFYALGAAHFIGDEGIVALLRVRGYTVTRVVPADGAERTGGAAAATTAAAPTADSSRD